jgi:hypothetical protein
MNTYTTKSPREGITQYAYSTGYTLSVGMGDMHYSDGETTAEIAVLDPKGDFVPLTSYDDVLGYQPLSRIEEFKEILASEDNPTNLLVEASPHSVDWTLWRTGK